MDNWNAKTTEQGILELNVLLELKRSFVSKNLEEKLCISEIAKSITADLRAHCCLARLFRRSLSKLYRKNMPS